MTSKRRTIALIGGGRWARVHASNLSHILTVDDRLLCVSNYNRDRMRRSIAELAKVGGPQIEIRSSVNEVLQEQPVAAIIVTTPSTHFNVAKACLSSGIHTLVEKPLALNVDEAKELADMAASKNLVLAVGLHLFSASYLHHLKKLLADGDIAALLIRWFDPERESRYGEEKRGDMAATMVHDVYPHIWSIIRFFDGSSDQHIGEITWLPGGVVLFKSKICDVMASVEISRGAKVRERSIGIKMRNGGFAKLDFSKEPGVPIVEGVPQAPDPGWGRSATPVMAEVIEFLKLIAEPALRANWPQLASECIDCVASADLFASKLATCTSAELRRRLQNGTALGDDSETCALIWETIVHPLAKRGLSPTVLDRAQQRLLIVEALRLLATRYKSVDAQANIQGDEQYLTQLSAYIGKLRTN